MARPASDISTRIVHAARELFLVHGVDGASLREIAKTAKTNIGMVYYYYETKDALFLAVVEEIYAGLLEDLRKALADDVAPEQRIARVYARIASFSDEELQVVRLILREALVSSSRLRSVVQRFQAGHLPLVANMLREGIARGSFRSDANPLALMAAVAALGFMPQVLRRLLEGTDLPIAKALPAASDAAGMMHELLLHGIAAKPVPRAKSPPKRRSRK
jgi:TetR/AcrR family transcriptional regulator